MDKEELLKNGNEAVAEALEGMYAIILHDEDENGNDNPTILTHAVGDKLIFSDKIECEKDCSTVLFASRELAKSAIEEILKPQYDGDYEVKRFADEFDVISNNIDSIENDELDMDDSSDDSDIEYDEDEDEE